MNCPMKKRNETVEALAHAYLEADVGQLSCECYVDHETGEIVQCPHCLAAVGCGVRAILQRLHDNPPEEAIGAMRCASTRGKALPTCCTAEALTKCWQAAIKAMLEEG